MEEAIAQELPLDFSISIYQGEDMLGGTEVMFSHVVAQGKPVVLNFWAGLCIPCRAEMASLQDAYEKFGDQVLLFGLDVGLLTGLGERKHALDLMELVGTTYPVGSANQPELIKKYRAMGIPTTLFIKPDGSVFQTWNGFIRWGQLMELIEELIDASI
jgi:thiol-disulfide isomerase/thioredoxin